jgi:hypothetical protein
LQLSKEKALRGFRKAFFAFIAVLHNVVGSKNMQPIREKYVPLWECIGNDTLV